MGFPSMLMQMERELEAIYHELKRLRRQGETSVYLSDESLELIRKETAKHKDKVHSTFKPERHVVDELKPEDLSALRAQVEKPAKLKNADAKTGKLDVKIISNVPRPPSVEIKGRSKEAKWTALRDLALGDVWSQSQLKEGKKAVFGIGNLNADLFFCGEAPGEEEEIQGEPFVGPAGQLLTKIIQAMGLKRESVYISNIMNYRPPVPTPVGNRPPTYEEMQYCLPYLKAQIAIIQPKVIVALGKTAVDGLLGPKPSRRMGNIRGIWDNFEDCALLPTFHPSYLLRTNNNRTKRQVWEDMLLVMEKLNMPISEKQRGYFA